MLQLTKDKGVPAFSFFSFWTKEVKKKISKLGKKTLTVAPLDWALGALGLESSALRFLSPAEKCLH